jgi:hypothetical protein
MKACDATEGGAASEATGAQLAIHDIFLLLARKMFVKLSLMRLTYREGLVNRLVKLKDLITKLPTDAS